MILVKIKRIIKYGLLSLVILPILYLSFYGAGNYAGVCMDNFKVIPGHVKAQLILHNGFKSWNKVKTIRIKKQGGKHYIDDRGRKKTIRNHKEYKIIPYQDIKEFLSLHPNSTSVVDLNTYPRDYAPNPTFYSRIVGNHMGYVKIEFPYRYMDEDGNIKYNIEAKYREIHNCIGKIRR